MSSKSIWTKLLVLTFSISLLASCGGGGGGTPPPANEGSIANPVNLGTALTTITHAGSVSAGGTSFYKFMTGPTSTTGSYTISLTNTHSDLDWVLLSDPGFTTVVTGCDNFVTPGDEICSIPLTAGTTYYLAVDEYDAVAGTFTLKLIPPGTAGVPVPLPANEGSIASPVSLGTISTTLTHSGSVGAFGTSFYTFTTGSTSGTYTVSLTNTHSDLSWAFADSGFTTPIFVCDNSVIPGANDEICPYTLIAGTTYYLAVDEWDTVPGTFTLTIAP